MIVAVDGPSGAGKSSVCRAIANREGFILVDTGALYRAVALMAQREGISVDDAERLGQLTRTLSLSFVPGDDEQRLLCNGEDITAKIRTAEISQRTSQISQHASVRAALLFVQREMGRQERDVILEGRDIGTVVFPDAELKVFFTASTEARAERRWRELQEKSDEPLSLEEIRAQIISRDERDRNRAIAPLQRADGAFLLDTSAMDFEASFAALVALIEAARAA